MRGWTIGVLALLAVAALLWMVRPQGAPPRVEGHLAGPGAGSGDESASAPSRPPPDSDSDLAARPTPARASRSAGERTVVVTVLDDASGAPIEGARVMARVPNPAGEDKWVKGEWVTGVDGRARIGPFQGDFLQVLGTASGHIGSDWVEAQPPEENIEVRLVAGGRIAGRVIGPTGQVVRTIRVRASPLYRGWQATAVASSDGSFQIDTLSPGRAEIVAAGMVGDREAFGRTEADVGSTDVVIRLELAPTLSAEVLGPDGAPVPQAKVAWRVGPHSGDGWETRGKTTFEASVLLESLHTGETLRLEVYDALDENDDPLPAGPAHWEGVVHKEEAIVIRLPPERAISGVVRDEEGTPAGGVHVVAVTPAETTPSGSASSPRRWEAEQEHGSAYSEENGSFRIGQLGEGTYEVSAEAGGTWLDSPPLHIEAGASDVALVVRRGVVVNVTVQDADGQPLLKARAKAEPMNDRVAPDLGEARTPYGLRSAQEGRIRLHALDPRALYVLWVAPPNGRNDLVRQAISPWTPADTTVRLERGRLLTGIVRDGKGHPVPHARAEWRRSDGLWVGTEAGDDGRFALRGLPVEAVRLRARHRPPPAWGTRADDGAATGPVGEEVVAAPDQCDVTLVVDAGATLTIRLPLPFGDFTTVWLLMAEGDGFVPIATEWIDDYKEYSLRGLDPTRTYAVYASTDEGPELGWRTGLHPGPDPVVLERGVGKSIHARVQAPPGATGTDVRASLHGIPLEGTRRGDGTWEIPHLLDGTWPVTATAEVDGARWTATADVHAGETVDLVLKPIVR